ncbi:MAG: flagellar biosynthesis protein FlhB [Oscillospiraceae bacterium]|nr:flagellar biosynthesis protein FlhB [Oscillospiraceae bacterium]
MPDNSSGEKTEKASPKKRQDERKKGNVFMSKDITTIVSLVAAFYIISVFVGSFIRRIQETYAIQMTRLINIHTLTEADLMQIFIESLVLFGTTMLPAILLIGCVTVMVVLFQTRFLISYESIKFKLERLDPIKGFKRLVSLRSLVELLKSIIKISLLAFILYRNIVAAVNIVPSMLGWEITQGIQYAGREIMALILTTALAFGVVAMLDYLYQLWEYERNIRMSKQEVKDEYKQMEGSPEIKGARRQKQREYAQRRMMNQVKEADVVVRNPTHFAIAIKYDLNSDAAPMVLAKGQDKIAEKIIEEAEKHGIMTVENPPLARSLYELADVDGYIPAELYQSVAELLAWIYTNAGTAKAAS